MLLHEILKVLHKSIEPMGYRIVDCFELIFENIIYDQNQGVDDLAKKLFSGARAFSQDTTRNLCKKEKFDCLCINIQNNYLTIAGNHYGIYNEILKLLSDCIYMRSEYKQKIIAACDYTQTAELACLIAACIVCGNYNTLQSNSKNAQIGENYSLSIDYMKLGTSIEEMSLKKELWIASKERYIDSHNKGNRFYALNIIERLLPQGFFTNTYFLSCGKTEDGRVAPISELCRQTDSNIAIIGAGGIGKTTFLQHMMMDLFLQPDGSPKEYMTSDPVPFFIELNRCPDHIADWYSNSLRKTNFITRYIGQIKENHSSLDSVSDETLDMIEKELQKIPSGGKPQYVLLLDGFNEVRADHSVRKYLSGEISALRHYSNVRIITTSRETQAAYYASEFENIHLVGVGRNDIVAHLKECHISEVVIGNAMACESLVECLRIPLYLCMFSSQKSDDEFLPETAGEILYCFFHRHSAFYNARRRMTEANTCELGEAQIALILDFIIPYIGWMYEENDIFSMSEKQFYDIVKDALLNTKTLFGKETVNPFSDFKYNRSVLVTAIDTLYINGDPDVSKMITCMYDYLGIVYQYQISEGDFADRIRYAFCHHQFRDYFSAMWDVQILTMLQCMTPDDFSLSQNNGKDTPKYFLDMRYWQLHKVQFISEILMEHRNRPYLNEQSLNWYLPKLKYDEQNVLTCVLDYCRKLYLQKIQTEHLLQNVLSSILYGRKEYSGIDLSNLNLKNCRFFNVTCSRQGKNSILAVDFSGSILTEDNFLPEDHQNSIMEYVYHNNRCYTVDDSGIIKCWDVFSGKMEYELKSGDPLGISDFSAKGYIKISKNGHWLAAKVQETQSDGDTVSLYLFNLTEPTQKPKIIHPPMRHKLLTYFAFTEDSKSILLLCDRKIVYCVDLDTQNINYSSEFELYKQSELYAENADSCIFAYTAEYDTYETDPALMAAWVQEDTDDYEEWDYSDDEDDENFEDAIACALCVLNPKTKESRFVYHYSSEPRNAPTITYLSEKKSFIIYNYDKNRIEVFQCETERCKPILEHLEILKKESPTAIHPHSTQANEIFIMYPNVCFDADITNGGNILMTYTISGIEKLLPHSDQSGELEFVSNVAPKMNRFIVANDTNTYEWDSANDTLPLKYNSALFGCTALFTNISKDSFILVHQYNGISIFGGTPIIMQKQYCFYEAGYQIGDACFDPLHEILALSFVRPDHEKVVILNVKTGMQKDVFSALDTGESFANMCFSDDGNFLLVTSQYRCVECNLENMAQIIISSAGDNERFISGNYVGEEVEIAVVEHSAVSEPKVHPYCIYYKKVGKIEEASYKRSWYYVMPKLEKTLFSKFIYQNNDLGALGSLNEDGIQQYWATSGFVLEKSLETKSLLHPKCYTWRGNRKIIIDKVFKPLEMIYVWHTSELTNQYGCGRTNCSFIYLSDDMTEAIFVENRQKLLYCENIKELTYEVLAEKMKKCSSNANQNAFWDFAVPQNNLNILGCYEFYNLMEVDSTDNTLLNSIPYYPGISIVGCSFDNAITDETVRSIINSNNNDNSNTI